MRNFVICSIVLFFYGEVLKSQCVGTNTFFDVGEVLEYDAVYNWGLIRLDAGDVRFEVKDTLFKNEPSYLFRAVGWSHKNYDWIYRVRDTFTAISKKKGMEPFDYHRKTSEGGYAVDNRFTFDYSDSLVRTSTWNSKQRKKNIGTLKVTPCLFDVLTAVYVCRTLDFSSYNANDIIPVSVLIEGDSFDLYIRYLGKEELKISRKKRYHTLKFSVLLVEGTIFSGGEDLFVWVTDDGNRVPILVEAKILVGSVKAVLKSASGLLHSQSALLK